LKLYYIAKAIGGNLRVVKSFTKEIVQAFGDNAVRITVELARAKRSTNQNAYYWGVVLPYIRDGFIDLGNLIQRNNEGLNLIHELMKSKFLNNGTELADVNGEIIQGPSTTTTLTKEEFSDYIEEIKQWSGEFLGIDIPDAGTQGNLF